MLMPPGSLSFTEGRRVFAYPGLRELCWERCGSLPALLPLSPSGTQGLMVWGPGGSQEMGPSEPHHLGSANEILPFPLSVGLIVIHL